MSVPSSSVSWRSVPADRLKLDVPRLINAEADRLGTMRPVKRRRALAVTVPSIPDAGREDDVEHLALARIFRAVEVARAKFDADHAPRRDAREQWFRAIPTWNWAARR